MTSDSYPASGQKMTLYTAQSLDLLKGWYDNTEFPTCVFYPQQAWKYVRDLETCRCILMYFNVFSLNLWCEINAETAPDFVRDSETFLEEKIRKNDGYNPPTGVTHLHNFDLVLQQKERTVGLLGQ